MSDLLFPAIASTAYTPCFTSSVGFWLCALRKYIYMDHEMLTTPDQLSDPQQFDLPASSQNVRIPSVEGDMGAWYMSPSTGDGSTVVLYLHGVFGTRGYVNRVGLYKKLLDMGLSVLAIDYRGFGDSDELEVTEATQMEDALEALRYIEQTYAHQNIVIWGHSLGSGVAARFSAVASNSAERARNGKQYFLVLESAFDELEGAIRNDLAQSNLGGILLGKADSFSAWLHLASVSYSSVNWLPLVSWPTIMLHAEDDNKVPLDLAKNLFEKTKEAGKQDITMVVFNKDFQFGHSLIQNYVGLGDLTTRFLGGQITNEAYCPVETNDATVQSC